MVSSELPVYRDVWEMVSQMEAYIRNFPREAKFSHGLKLRDEGAEVIKNICMANNCTNDHLRRARYIEIALGHYETYKFIKRLCAKHKYMSEAQEAKIDKRFAIVGQQLMGWKISEENKLPGQNRDGQGHSGGPKF